MGSYRLLAMAAAIALLPSVTHGQAVTRPASTALAGAKAGIARWFELQNVTLNLRYRYIDTTAGRVTTNQLSTGRRSGGA